MSRSMLLKLQKKQEESEKIIEKFQKIVQYGEKNFWNYVRLSRELIYDLACVILGQANGHTNHQQFIQKLLSAIQGQAAPSESSVEKAGQHSLFRQKLYEKSFDQAWMENVLLTPKQDFRKVTQCSCSVVRSTSSFYSVAANLKGNCTDEHLDEKKLLKIETLLQLSEKQLKDYLRMHASEMEEFRGKIRTWLQQQTHNSLNKTLVNGTNSNSKRPRHYGERHPEFSNSVSSSSVTTYKQSKVTVPVERIEKTHKEKISTGHIHYNYERDIKHTRQDNHSLSRRLRSKSPLNNRLRLHRTSVVYKSSKVRLPHPSPLEASKSTSMSRCSRNLCGPSSSSSPELLSVIKIANRPISPSIPGLSADTPPSSSSSSYKIYDSSKCSSVRDEKLSASESNYSVQKQSNKLNTTAEASEFSVIDSVTTEEHELRNGTQEKRSDLSQSSDYVDLNLVHNEFDFEDNFCVLDEECGTGISQTEGIEKSIEHSTDFIHLEEGEILDDDEKEDLKITNNNKRFKRSRSRHQEVVAGIHKRPGSLKRAGVRTAYYKPSKHSRRSTT